MSKAAIIVDKDFAVGEIDRLLFSGFLEQMGRSIYGGVYEPGHGNANAEGFREDVAELLKELNLASIRYPGGNFVSNYNWEDGVGPKEDRPRRLDSAWKSIEPNEFGTNEFVKLCRHIGTDPLMAVNLGTRGMEEARNLLEYCNFSDGSQYSDLRREHGFENPHDIKLWCLGNEMDGSWQTGFKSAEAYGTLADQTGKLMKMLAPEIKLVVCGSSSMGMQTFGDWELTVLRKSFEIADYISLHTYTGNYHNDTPRYLAYPDTMDRYIERVVALADAEAARRRSDKKIMLSFDEWNVWYRNRGCDHGEADKWQVAPSILEEVYNLEDALAVGGMLISLLNHCDRVKIACIAQLVNVIGPIMTRTGGPAWKQTIFHPFAQASNLASGVVLRQNISCETYSVEENPACPKIKSSITYNEDSKELAVFVLNRDLESETTLEIEFRGFSRLAVKDQTELCGPDLKAINDEDNPELIKPAVVETAETSGCKLTATLAPASWNVITLAAE